MATKARKPVRPVRKRIGSKHRRGATDRRLIDSAWSNVPGPVRAAFNQDLWLIPRVLNTANGRWHPPFKWKEFKDERPTKADIIEWNERYPDALWAIITGHERIVAEFDGEEGLATMERLGLVPHFISPSGGGHVHIKAPGYLVRGGPRVDPARFPNMDLLAYGQTATIYGKRPPDGSYRRNPEAPKEPYTLDGVRVDLREFIVSRRFKKSEMRLPEIPDDFEDFASVAELLGEFLRRSIHEGRNNMAFELAKALRDEHYTFRQVVRVLKEQYTPIVRDLETPAFDEQEAYDTVVSAFTHPPRLPRRLLRPEGVVRMSKVQLAEVRWLWRPWIAEGKVSLFDGNKGRNKSTISIDLVARVTTGEPMPGESEGSRPGSSLIICNEDDPEDTIKARLLAADADLNLVGWLKPRRDPSTGRLVPIQIPEDLSYIEEEIRKLEKDTGVPAKLVVIDPILGYLSERIHYGNDPQVRKAMLPLAETAQELRVAFLLIRHLNKNTQLDAEHRGGGSVAFPSASRTHMMVEWHPESPATGVLAMVNTNLTRKPRSFTFQPVDAFASDGEVEVETLRIKWGEPIDLTAERLLRKKDARKKSPIGDQIRAWLRERLDTGPVPVKEVQSEAKGAGFSWRTVQEVAEKMDVERDQVRKPDGTLDHWTWALLAESGTVIRFPMPDDDEGE